MSYTPDSYTPDNWVILKIDTDTEPYYKLLVGWSGGYLNGDSWKLNSGIVKIEQSDTHYDFVGESGSSYHCHKDAETVRMNISGILSQLLDIDHVSGVKVADILELFDTTEEH